MYVIQDPPFQWSRQDGAGGAGRMPRETTAIRDGLAST